jgi:hypothetical protein
VAGHRRGVAQAEVDVLVAVDVGEPGAAGTVGIDRVAGGVLVHPRHRHPAEQVAGVGVRRGRPGVAVGEPGLLAFQQHAEVGAVEGVGRHGATVPMIAPVGPRQNVRGCDPS